MTPERVAKLDDLGFSWEVRPCLERPRATWQQRYDELRDFYTDNHHFLVPAGEKPQLHSWCQEQKQRLKNLEKNGKDVSKRMGPERQKMLEELGFTKDVVLAPPGEDLGHYDHDEDDDEDHDDEEEDAKPAAQVEGEVEV